MSDRAEHWFKAIIPVNAARTGTHLAHFNTYTKQYVYVGFGNQWNLYLREAVTVYAICIYDECTGQAGATGKVHNH